MTTEKTKTNLNPMMAPLPQDSRDYPRGLYDTFPTFPIGNNKLESGYKALAAAVAVACSRELRVLAIDGYNGVDWQTFKSEFNTALTDQDLKIQWMDIKNCLMDSTEIEALVKPFLGGDDPLFGTHFPMGMEVFFDPVKLARVRIDAAEAREYKTGNLTIIFGCGAGLIELWDRLWYIDIPKDVIQERAREREVTNLATDQAADSFGIFYKRSYFVDWPALNRQKRNLLDRIDCLIDLQDSANPVGISGDEFRNTLAQLGRSPFRVRPWFYPGPWGGKYMQGHMGLDPKQPNFAWSFELIVPENGIVLRSGDQNLEFSFDFLMFQENEQVLGPATAKRFIYEWPIRLDYLDTIDGGNLSTQVHPRPDFIRRNFGETYTQDEAYYIANAKPDARVYVGLTETCDLDEFQQALSKSEQEGVEVKIDKFVNSVPVKPHDLVLIPNGTVHCSGTGNLVLEISATPYIFTFKIYDYLRRDLEGNLRPMNIDRAFKNIRPERRTDFIRNNYLPQPRLVREGADWSEYILYERPETFYNIHRLEFESSVDLEMDGKAYAVNLVDGEMVMIKSTNGYVTTLARFESMLIPAGAEKVKFTNQGASSCKVVLVYIRETVGGGSALNIPLK